MSNLRLFKFLALFIFANLCTFTHTRQLNSLRDQRVYYWWKKFDYIDYQLNRLETRLDRARDYVRRQRLFRSDLEDYLHEQQACRNPVQIALAHHRLKEWCDISRCEICKLMRKVDTVQRQICYEWRELDLVDKIEWIDQAILQCEDREIRTLRKFALKIQQKYARLEQVYRELQRYAGSACRY